MSQPFVRPDVRMFLEFLNNIPGPKMHEVSAPEARTTYAAMKDVADPPAGELAIKRDLKCDGIPVRLYDARERREPGPVLLFCQSDEGFSVRYRYRLGATVDALVPMHARERLRSHADLRRSACVDKHDQQR